MSSILTPDEAKTLLEQSIRGELPDARGRFGPFGGRYIPETLVPAFERLEEGIRRYLNDDDFQSEYVRELKEWVGRPTALTRSARPCSPSDWARNVSLPRPAPASTG